MALKTSKPPGRNKAVKKAFIFSIEALLAAILLFGIFLLTSNLGRLSGDYSQNSKILSAYTQGLASSLENSGALDQLFSQGSDELIKNISLSMPPSVCSQIEIYRPYPIPQDLYYSYTTPNCTRYWSTPISQYTFSHEKRNTTTDINVYWIKEVTYAKE